MNNNKIRFDIKKMVDRKEPRVPIFLNFFDLPVLVKYQNSGSANSKK